nr:lipoyl(octanoyl) transferase LipB [Robiginitomaculum antarcticum]
MTTAAKLPPCYNDSLIELRRSSAPVAYPNALSDMETRNAAIAAGEAREQIWLLEHPPLYTAGTSAKREDLLTPHRFDVFEAGRGGQYTYHGPGQRVAYVMVDLKTRGRDIRCFVNQMEAVIIDALSEFGVRAERREGRIGVWTVLPGGGEAKIAALGVRIRKWVTYHGISINVLPDLSHFSGIVPCGIAEHGVTSLSALGSGATLQDVDAALLQAFTHRFGPIGA